MRAASSAQVRDANAWPTRRENSSLASMPCTNAALSTPMTCSRSAWEARRWPRPAAAGIWSRGSAITGTSPPTPGMERIVGCRVAGQPRTSRSVPDAWPGPTTGLPRPSQQAPNPCEWLPGLGWRSHREATPAVRPRRGGRELANRWSGNPCTNYMQKALFLFERGPLALVAGAGFEPATSGL